MSLFSSLSDLLPKPDATVRAEFLLDGTVYNIEQFDMTFNQPIGHDGKPQQETIGGSFSITILQLPDSNLYEWAKRSKLAKNGTISFISQTVGTFFKVEFTYAYCVHLSTGVNDTKGTISSLRISAEEVNICGVRHKNTWTNK